MKRARITLTVGVDLDPIPGWGDNAEDWRTYLQGHLDQTVPHYHPKVEVAP